jgi:1-deoxy-D-xylulose-5-phosphate synthase
VVFCLDRAGVTGDDGPSHHGMLDLAQCLSIPNMAVFAPSSAGEVEAMLRTALTLSGPAAIRYPKTPARVLPPDQVGQGLSARLLRRGGGRVCLLGVGKLVGACEEAAQALAEEGVDATVWDVRVVRPADAAMLADAADHDLVVVAEDGIRIGGAGSHLADALAGMAPTPPGPPVLTLGLPHAYLPQGKPDAILADLGLDGPGITSSVLAALACGTASSQPTLGAAWTIDLGEAPANGGAPAKGQNGAGEAGSGPATNGAGELAPIRHGGQGRTGGG